MPTLTRSAPKSGRSPLLALPITYLASLLGRHRDPSPRYERASSGWLSVMLALLIPVAACSESPAAPEPEIEEPEIEVPIEEPEVTDTVSAEPAVDRGEVGVVVDVREIVRKGYAATSVSISFPDHPKFDETVEVDAVTGLAILRIHNDALTEAEKDAFASGVAAKIVVADAAGGDVASQTETSLVLDDSGVPRSIGTNMPRVLASLAIRSDVPYLIHPEDADGVLFREVTGTLGPETETPLVGGTVGILSEARCADGSVAVGHRGGETGSDLTSMGLVCAVLESDGTLGATSNTPTIGAITPSPNEALCPMIDGTSALLVRGAGRINDTAVPDRIRNVRGHCLSFDDAASGLANASAAPSTGELGGTTVAGDPSYNLACPDGSLITGVHARRGLVLSHVVQIGYYCRALTAGWGVAAYAPDTPAQQFYVTPVAGAPDDNTFVVRQAARYWAVAGGVVTLTAVEVDATQFVLEQDDDGWVRIRVAGTADYLVLENGDRIATSADEVQRFRLITDNIDWTVTDRGTVFHQPVRPPARLDFAYAATIKNCSPASVTETIGRTETRTQTATFSTSESLQLFAGYELSVGTKVGVEVGGGIGPAQVKGTAELSINHSLSVSATHTTSNTIGQESTKSSEVSRTRELEVPPFTAIEAYDAVRTIQDFRIPFTQVFRFSGTYEDGTPLTGAEILSQLHFNLVEGVPTAIGANHVDMGVRGSAAVDQMFEAETQVNEIPDACN